MEATETAEIEALRDLFAACPDDIAAANGVATITEGDALACRVAALSGVAEVNHALGVSTAAQLDAFISFYARTEHIVSPRPGADLDTALRGRGYEPGYAWMKFRRGVERPPNGDTDLRIEEVGADAAGDFARTLCAGYGMPESLVPWLDRLPGRVGWHCFVAYDGAQPAATGALHVHADTGWLGMAATLASHRRRGAQNAILAARVARAADRGCTVVVTETGELVEGRPSSSYRNILRNGFEPAYLRANYATRA